MATQTKPGLKFSSDPYFVQNFKATEKKTSGFITEMSINGKPLDKTYKFPDPENSESQIEAVAFMNYYEKGKNATDSNRLELYIHVNNKGLVASELAKKTSDEGFSLEFVPAGYEFDHKENKYFQAVHSDGTPLKAKCLEGSDNVELGDNIIEGIGLDNQKVVSMNITFSPDCDAGAQQLQRASSATLKWSDDFGAEGV